MTFEREPEKGEFDFFLSGPISGVKDYKVRFARAVVAVRRQHPGARIWNPAEMPDDREYRWYMWQCIRALFASKKIVMIGAWSCSPGALAERALAMCIGVESVTVEGV